MLIYIIGAVLVVVMFLIITNLKIVRQSEAVVVERLGAYHKTCNVGVHMKLPRPFERWLKPVSLKEQVVDYPEQPVITKDNITMDIDSVIYYQITDVKLYTYGVENPKMALRLLTETTLRNVIGELELDETLTSRDVINSKLRTIIDEASDPWGIKVTRVEVKNIEPPQSVTDAMEKQMRAERERREQILIAEGHKQSEILEAEGKKQSMVLQAEADKESAILRATGEAESIRLVQEAKAQGLKVIRDAQLDDATLKLRSLEAFEKVADGQATKIIIPSEIQSMTGLVTALKESVNK